MIDVADAARTTTPDHPDHTAAARRAAGWLPCAVVTVASLVVLHHYGVTPAEIAAFAAYSLLGVTLPGLLLWRACAGRAGLLATDVAAGTAHLRDRYHVRWLVTIGRPNPALATLATLRYTAHDIAIYEINR